MSTVNATAHEAKGKKLPVRLLATVVATLCVSTLVAVQPAAADPDIVPFAVPGGCYEPHTAVNPTDPTNVAVAECDRIAVSTNLGRTFTVGFVNTTTLPAGITAGTWTSCADPALAFDSQGQLFWTYILCADYAPADGNPDEITVVVAQINPTTGALINTPVDVSPGQFSDDKPWLAADADPASPHVDNLYLVWSRFQTNQVLFSRSTDQGVTWSAPQPASANETGCTAGFARADACWPPHVAAAANGDVYVGYHTDNCGAATADTVIVRDTTGGANLASGGAVTRSSFQSATTCNVQNNFDNRGPAIPNTDFWLQGNMQPWIVPDPTRPGNVYVVVGDDPDDNFATGDASDVTIARSTDSGATWTMSAVSSGPANTVQVMPAAAIDENGDLVAFWYDTRRNILNDNGTPSDTTDDYFNLDVFATVSHDGGVTFSADRRINDVQFDPNQGARCRFGCGGGEGPMPPETLRIGEYNGLAAANGNAYAAWTGNQGGAQTALFDVFRLDPIELTTSPNPSEFAEPVQIAATVTGEPGSAVPTGTVSFAVDGAAVGGPVALDASGTAVVSVATLAVGTHTVSASYSGNAIHPTAEDFTTHTVNRARTTVALTSSTNPSLAGDAVTFLATVTGDPGGPVPTGTVTFRDGATPLDSASVDGTGVATLTTSSLAVGSHPITAQYSGDDNHLDSTSAVLTQRVNLVPTTLRAEPAVLKVSGLLLRLSVINASARLTPTNGGAPISGQPIAFRAGNQQLCTAVTDGNGFAKCPPVPVSGVLAVLLAAGYDASFAGSPTHASSSARGPLIGG